MGGEKNLSVETLRGIAITLVVAGHVVGSGPDGGMCVPYPSIWRYLHWIINYIQMPLFTAIAGWAFGMKPAGSIAAGRFVKNKALRLLVPMVTVSAIFYVIQSLVPGTNSPMPLDEIWRILIFPHSIYWYLKAIFLIFMAALLLDHMRAMSTVKSWAATLAVTLALYVAEKTIIPYSVPNIFAFKGALDQLPYFIAGVGICRFGPELFKRLRGAMFAAAVAGIVVLHLGWFFPPANPELYRSLLPLWLVPTLFIIFRYARPCPIFTLIGAYSYSIYLFQDRKSVV